MLQTLKMFLFSRFVQKLKILFALEKQVTKTLLNLQNTFLFLMFQKYIFYIGGGTKIFWSICQKRKKIVQNFVHGPARAKAQRSHQYPDLAVGKPYLSHGTTYSWVFAQVTHRWAAHSLFLCVLILCLFLFFPFEVIFYVLPYFCFS